LIQIASGQKTVEDHSNSSLHFATAFSAQVRVKFCEQSFGAASTCFTVIGGTFTVTGRGQDCGIAALSPSVALADAKALAIA
jgi:hypothetical protein